MKRILLYVGILAAVIAAPVEPLNVGQMLPVQVVALSRENGWTVIETDTGNRGIGGTAKQALRNLKDRANGKIYLDTAEYLLLGKETADAVEELRNELRQTIQLCEMAKPIDLAQAANYLKAHGKLPRLKDWKRDAELPVLSLFEESLIFLKKVENSA